jgi:hypothetical protein
MVGLRLTLTDEVRAMRKGLLLVGVIALVPVLSAASLDKRLATARTAFVEASDPLGDDQPISACLKERLDEGGIPSLAESKEAADIVLTISRGQIVTGFLRFGSFLGGATVKAQLPDGTLLWENRATVSASTDGEQEQIPTGAVPCRVADEILNRLRNAMKQARDRKG